jgi:hypothetical protein
MLTSRKADPELAECAGGFIFGNVWGRQRLTHGERMRLTISSLAGNGHVDWTKNSVNAAPKADFPVRNPHGAILQNVVYCEFPSRVQALRPWRAALHSSCSCGQRPTGRQGRFRSALKCVSILAEVDALIDLAPPAPRRKVLKEHFEDQGGYQRALRGAGLTVLSWPNRYGINRMSCARNSLSRPLIRASNSQMAISAFKWWGA